MRAAINIVTFVVSLLSVYDACSNLQGESSGVHENTEEGGSDMSEFSEQLEKYILSAGLTEDFLAKATGFSRSYVARLKNGQRVSPDVKRMTRLFDMLRLSETEYRQLWALYQKERLGTDQYNLNKTMLDFISGFHQVPRFSAPVSVAVQLPRLSTVTGRADVEMMLRLLIHEEASRESGHLRMLLQADNRNVNEALKLAFQYNTRLRVDHLVCLEPCREKSQESGRAKYYNVQLLHDVIPILLSGKNADYQLYYHYNSVDSHFNTFSLMPYVMITSSCVACMDISFEHMALHWEPEICDLYRWHFDTQRDLCPRLFQFISGAAVLQQYNKLPSPGKTVFSMAEQPCLGFTHTDALVDKYAAPGVPSALISGFKQKLSSNREQMKKENIRLVSYFTESGVERFLREGRFDELPEEVYRPLEPADRYRQLRELITMAETGTCELYLMEAKKFRFPSGLILDGLDFDKVFLSFRVDRQENCLILREGSLTRIFYDFLADFRESDCVLPAEETVLWLKQQLKAM